MPKRFSDFKIYMEINTDTFKLRFNAKERFNFFEYSIALNFYYCKSKLLLPAKSPLLNLYVCLPGCNSFGCRVIMRKIRINEKNLLCPGPERSAAASCNRIVRPSVGLSVRLSVRP